jgi:glutamate formiminotransferase
MRNSELLAFEPESIRLDDGGLHTLESNGLELKDEHCVLVVQSLHSHEHQLLGVDML